MKAFYHLMGSFGRAAQQQVFLQRQETLADLQQEIVQVETLVKNLYAHQRLSVAQYAAYEDKLRMIKRLIREKEKDGEP